MLKHFGQAGIAVGRGELHDGQRAGMVEDKRMSAGCLIAELRRTARRNIGNILSRVIEFRIQLQLELDLVFQ